MIQDVSSPDGDKEDWWDIGSWGLQGSIGGQSNHINSTTLFGKNRISRITFLIAQWSLQQRRLTRCSSFVIISYHEIIRRRQSDLLHLRRGERMYLQGDQGTRARCMEQDSTLAHAMFKQNVKQYAYMTNKYSKHRWYMFQILYIQSMKHTTTSRHDQAGRRLTQGSTKFGSKNIYSMLIFWGLSSGNNSYDEDNSEGAQLWRKCDRDQRSQQKAQVHWVWISAKGTHFISQNNTTRGRRSSK